MFLFAIYALTSSTRRMAANNKTVTLVSEDGESFCIDAALVAPAAVLQGTVEDNGGDDIPVEGDSVIVAMLIDFLNMYAKEACKPIEKPLQSTKLEELVQAQYARLVDIELEHLFKLILLANFVECRPLLELSCGKVACMVKGKSIEEVRNLFHIKNDFTPEEEKQVQEEYRLICEAKSA